MAIKAGASALGLVGNMPGGPGVISDELIFQIASQVSPPTETFLLTSETTVDGIVSYHNRTRTTTIQLVDQLTGGTFEELKQELPNVKIVQVIHVIDNKSVDEAIRISEKADALLLDSGNPNLRVKELGGTGRTHNWDLSRQIVEQSSNPVYLAGGLNPENVAEAFDRVKPFGLDVCTGVRTNGILDEQKLNSFIENALA